MVEPEAHGVRLGGGEVIDVVEGDEAVSFANCRLEGCTRRRAFATCPSVVSSSAARVRRAMESEAGGPNNGR
ncbi:hypothetical protein OG780_07925 [Streptomyces sp. NBC_00386]|uniref:hypothetical protein n=1 Tax=Streptomyces sp. NBC_00386 TaxID=2975734 RepID=UPI002E1E4F49